MVTGEIILILHCARCGQDHEATFYPFKGHPFEDADGVVYGRWGFCPETGDPILMTTITEDTDEAD